MLVLFGHQSVGQNLLDGLRELARDGVSTPELLAIDEIRPPQSPVAVRAFRVGRNRDPLGKFRHFAEAVAGESARRPDVAMLKLCYADIQDETAVPSLFNEYARMIDAVQADHPDILVAHVTVPLRSISTGAAANRARHAFSELLRERFASRSPVFDLAGIESAGHERPRPASGMVAAPALNPRYTDDGGHLNQAGRRVVAKEFVAFLDRLQSECDRSSGTARRRIP